jgi:hypothetical protein
VDYLSTLHKSTSLELRMTTRAGGTSLPRAGAHASELGPQNHRIV